MLAANFSTVRSRMKEFCDKVVHEGETVIVTRKDDENVVIVSMADYNAMAKAARNAEYLGMLDQRRADLDAGQGVTMSMNELDALFSSLRDESKGDVA